MLGVQQHRCSQRIVSMFSVTHLFFTVCVGGKMVTVTWSLRQVGEYQGVSEHV